MTALQGEIPTIDVVLSGVFISAWHLGSVFTHSLYFDLLPVVGGHSGSFEHDRVTRVLDQEVGLPLFPHFLCSSQLQQMGPK